MTKVSIIIPVFNLWEMTKQCLESIASTCTLDISQSNIEVIVINNNSSDETINALDPTLAQLFGKNGKALHMPENLGFAKACNAGASAASHPLLFFLNNDTILTTNWLSPLVNAIETNPKIGVVGPLLLYPNNTVQHYGICSCHRNILHHVYEQLPNSHRVVSKPQAFQAVTGAAMLMPAKLFLECGNFCEEYINGLEDVDLCYSIGKKSLLCVCVPQSRIYHLTSKTAGRFTHESQNAKTFIKRNPHRKPDLHIVANADGFVPMFGARFNTYIALPEAKEKALTMAFSTNFDLQKCHEKLLAEPYWFGGYELMAKHCEQQEQWLNCVTTLLQLINFNPQLKYFEDLKRVWKHIELKDALVPVLEHEKLIIEDMENTDKSKQMALYLQDLAKKTNDLILNRMVDDWLKAYT